ncbi:hypothetical protein AMTRI_Chr09g41980 [Amborella trichopoda]
MGWCPETATRAYLDTVKLSRPRDELGVAELLSALAGGIKAQLIIQVRHPGSGVASSLGLSTAARHTCGRHIIVVPDDTARAEYLEAVALAGAENEAEILVGDFAQISSEIADVDFAVVDCRGRDHSRVLRLLKLSQRGAVVVCKNAGLRAPMASTWQKPVVRSALLPIGKGLEITQLGEVAVGSSGAKKSRWIVQVDRHTGEEHVFRR